MWAGEKKGVGRGGKVSWSVREEEMWEKFGDRCREVCWVWGKKKKCDKKCWRVEECMG